MPISDWMRAIRAIVGTELVVMVGAAAIVRDDQGRVLLQRRTDDGTWGVPGGGIEPGEEPAQAAAREAFEETGYIVEVTRLLGVFGGHGRIKQYPNGDRFAYVSITFECRVVGGAPDPDPDETLEIGWFALDDLPQLTMSANQLERLHLLEDAEIPYFERVTALPDSPDRSYIADIRQKVGSLLLMSPGATGVIQDDQGRILVQKRRDDGLWNLPGGVYEPGEEPVETLLREMLEESGLHVNPLRLIGVYGGADYHHAYPNGDEVAYINIAFLCEIVGGELHAHDDESLALRFVAPDALPEPFYAPHKQIVQHAFERAEPFFAR